MSLFDDSLQDFISGGSGSGLGGLDLTSSFLPSLGSIGSVLGGLGTVLGGAARTAGGAVAGFCERNPTICQVGGGVLGGVFSDVLGDILGGDDEAASGGLPTLPTLPGLPTLPSGGGGGAIPAAAAGDIVALCGAVEQMRAARDQINAQLKVLAPAARKAGMLARLSGIPLPAGCMKWVRKRRKPCRGRRARSYGTSPRRRTRARARRACKTACARPRRRRRACTTGKSAAQRRFAAAARRFGGRIPRGTRL